MPHMYSLDTVSSLVSPDTMLDIIADIRKLYRGWVGKIIVYKTTGYQNYEYKPARMTIHSTVDEDGFIPVIKILDLG